MINPADQNRLLALSRVITGPLLAPRFKMTRRMAVAVRKAMRRFEIKVRNWLLTLAMYRVADLAPRVQPAPRKSRSWSMVKPIRTTPSSSYNAVIDFRGPAISRARKHDAKPKPDAPRPNSDHLLAAHILSRISEICDLIRAPEALIEKLARCMQIDTAAHAVRRPVSPDAPYTDDAEFPSTAPIPANYPNSS